MKGKYCVSVLTLLMVMVVVATASAEILADYVFNSATVSLNTSKSAVFSAETINEAESIKVTGVKLYKMVGGTWQFIQNLPAPSDESTNDIYFSASYDYSSYIGTGNYRLKVTFTADGHSISRYSNSRTF